jgi:transaldolase
MFISPFLGRLDDASMEGMELIEQICTVYANYEYETQVLAASIRHPVHVLQCAMIGAHCGTMPLPVIKQLYKHPLTDIGLEKFLADYEKSQEKAK